MRASRERCHRRCPPVAMAPRLPCPKPTQPVCLSSNPCILFCAVACVPLQGLRDSKSS